MTKRYQVYTDKSIRLIETMCIKSVETMEGLNRSVTDYYGSEAVDPGLPETWKYFLNLAGEYHFTDQLMTVTSWDTLEKITFDKNNLAVHRATFRAYSYGTTQYYELLKQYPRQELLIRGILNPVNIQTAIASEDGTILNYDTSLVEENEYTLIQKLEQWIKSYKVRWVNRQFEISDELYAATNHSILYSQLVLALLVFRLEACKTNEAHSYHITEYLLSHGLPEISIMHMTKKQMLFFYRNIKYIRKHAGKQDIFEWLVQHIMTERALPVSEFTMKHSDEDLLTTLLPDIQFKKTNLNTIYGVGGDEYFSLRNLLEREKGLTPNNTLVIEDDFDQIQSTLQQSLSNTVQTKVLESSVIDYTESGQNKPEEFLLQHWLYLSVKGIYQAHVGIQNPATGERIPLSAKDAFTLMIYAFARSMEIEMVYVPRIPAIRVQRLQTPSVSDLMSVVDYDFVEKSTAKQILSTVPEIKPIISTEAFNALGVKIYKSYMTQRNIPALFEHEYRRGLVQNMVSRVYCDVVCELEPEGTTYTQWFSDRNLDLSSFVRADYSSLYASLVKETTGMSLISEPNLQGLQAAMIKLFENLSSYSIQFVKNINSDGLVNMGFPMTRLGEIEIESDGFVPIIDMVSQLLSETEEVDSSISVDIIPEEEHEILGIEQDILFTDKNAIDVDDVPILIELAYRVDTAPVYHYSIDIQPL